MTEWNCQFIRLEYNRFNLFISLVLEVGVPFLLSVVIDIRSLVWGCVRARARVCLCGFYPDWYRGDCEEMQQTNDSRSLWGWGGGGVGGRTVGKPSSSMLILSLAGLVAMDTKNLSGELKK